MQVSRANDVAIYNLSAGKSLPDWLDERKRRTLLKKDAELRRRIELLQEFDMPEVSDNVTISKDGNFVVATGTYKPRVKCYDVSQLGLKFERCFDSEVVKCRLISEDYSKMVFLQCDRYVEIHAQGGRYYRLRIPRFGRDFCYHPGNCDLYFVGDGSAEIVRLNLEQGRFLNPMTSKEATGHICLELNPEHQLLVTGSVDGKVEAWDPRSRSSVGILDVAKSLSKEEGFEDASLPEVSSLGYRDGLNLAVGTSTGQILLYDIRSSKPLLVKDHNFGIPIKRVLFHSTLDQVLSLDDRVLRIWNRSDGKTYTSIEGFDVKLNDVAIYPGSGLLFLANEQPKMQVHYIPNLGPAPRWCGFLDSLTEELEESETTVIYDDYKFVTREELTDLGLDHLIGTSLLRAHMHGYFMDVRLYRKAQSIAKPYTLDNFMKDKVKSRLEAEREKRVVIKSKLPSVNKDLFLKLKDKEENDKKKKKSSNILEDERFKDIFRDPRFEVDTSEEAYRLINPVVSKLDASKKKKLIQQFEEVKETDEENEEKDSEFEDSSSSDDDQELAEELRRKHKEIRVEKAIAKKQEKEEKLAAKLSKIGKPKFYEIKDGEEFGNLKGEKKNKNLSLEERLQRESEVVKHSEGHQMTFVEKKSYKQLKAAEEQKRHMEERRKLRRSASGLKKKKTAPKFWMGQRVS